MKGSVCERVLLGGDDLVSSDTGDDDYRGAWLLGFRVYIGLGHPRTKVGRAGRWHQHEGTRVLDRICADS